MSIARRAMSIREQPLGRNPLVLHFPSLCDSDSIPVRRPRSSQSNHPMMNNHNPSASRSCDNLSHEDPFLFSVAPDLSGSFRSSRAQQAGRYKISRCALGATKAAMAAMFHPERGWSEPDESYPRPLLRRWRSRLRRRPSARPAARAPDWRPCSAPGR